MSQDSESNGLPEAVVPTYDLPTEIDLETLPTRHRGTSKEYSPALGNDLFLLPGGLSYKGELLKKVRLRPITGLDEEHLGTAEARRYQWRLADVMLSRQIESIEAITDRHEIEQIVPKLLLGDRTTLLIMLHKISESDMARMQLACERCKFSWLYQFDLDQLVYDVYLNKAPPESFSGILPKGHKDQEGTYHKDFSMRLIDGLGERIIEDTKDNVGSLKTQIFTATLVSLGAVDPIEEQVVRSLIKRDRSYMDLFQQIYTPGPHLAYAIPCEKCSNPCLALVRPESFFAF